jgi:molybdate transport system substrate-binding protein
MKFPSKLIVVLLVGLFAGPYARGQAVRVAAAADLKFAMTELATQFEKQNGTKLDVTYGSSGNFLTQIQNGAPFDLFFSADSDYPNKLEAAGLTEPGTLREYAIGRIVIWTPSESGINPAKDDWQCLLDPRVKKIAIANPEHAPYGRAALAAIKKSGIYEQVKAKLVYGENISQAAEFVQSGNAQVGIVALSLAVSPAMKNGNRWEIPPDSYPPLKQAAVLLKASKNKDASRLFLDFVSGTQGQEILKRFGFTAPTP